MSKWKHRELVEKGRPWKKSWVEVESETESEGSGTGLEVGGLLCLAGPEGEYGGPK